MDESKSSNPSGKYQRCLVVDLVVAWLSLFLIKIGRKQPTLPGSTIFEPDEWRALYGYFHQTTSLPPTEPTLQEMIEIIAKLGGFPGRKNDGYPGITVLWRGLRRFNDIVNAYRLFYLFP